MSLLSGRHIAFFCRCPSNNCNAYLESWDVPNYPATAAIVHAVSRTELSNRNSTIVASFIVANKNKDNVEVVFYVVSRAKLICEVKSVPLIVSWAALIIQIGTTKINVSMYLIKAKRPCYQSPGRKVQAGKHKI